MHTIRLAISADAATIAGQRVKMFQDNGLACVGSWEDLERNSTHWTAKKLQEGSYVGWMVEEQADDACGELDVIGGAGVWFMEWPPHYMHLEPMRGYLLNFYVAPKARGRAIAKQLVGLAVEECRRRGVRIATLHASKMGRPVYQSLGWKDSNEMMFRVQVEKLLSLSNEPAS